MASYLMSWSGGKDSALALYRSINLNSHNIIGLLTTINAASQRISMHGVALDILRLQASSIGLPLYILELPENCSMYDYENIMGNFMHAMKSEGLDGVIFGDIFLEDVKAYRQQQLAKLEFEAVFPLWGLETEFVANEFWSLGFKSIVTCADGELLNEGFVGQPYTPQFVASLPKGVDPCGENGEFHTFVHDGPIFFKPFDVKVTDKILKEYPNPDGGKPKPYWFSNIVSK